MKFSIITPVYNREDCVSRCIESVLRQGKTSHWEVEHILVDDGSVDLTPKICEGYAINNESIRLLSFPKNKGTNAARNAAINASTGDFIVILDSDDYFVDDALDFMAQVITENAKYNHFMFAPNDVNYQVPFFNDCKSKVLTYQDFLRGDVNSGFIHCISRNTMLKHPFNEDVRIHEGVFFLSFYKEAQNMLFTNRIVTIR